MPTAMQLWGLVRVGVNLSHVKAARAWDKPAPNVWGRAEPFVLCVHIRGPPPATSLCATALGLLLATPNQSGGAVAPRGVPVAARLGPALVAPGLTSVVRSPSFCREVKRGNLGVVG